MRLLIILPLLFAIYSASHAVDCAIQFTLSGATAASYQSFIVELQKELAAGNTTVYEIPVLKHDVTPYDRFILVSLANYDDKSITIAIDVTNVEVVGYLTGMHSYFFKDAPDDADILFPGSISRKLPYGGGYRDLERVAGVSREDLPLGLLPLHFAITSLLQPDEKAARSFLVVIQMVSEAARFRYIEKSVEDTIKKEFKPDHAVLSLENKWGVLSKQIQLALNNGGKFPSPVTVSSPSGNAVIVCDVSSPVVKDIALLEYIKVDEAGN